MAAGEVAADGTFEVKILEPAQSGGELKTWFVFRNGATTGDGVKRGRAGGLVKRYTYSGNRWQFR